VRRMVWGAVAGLAVAVGSCQLLPEKYAVNAPLGHLLFSRGADAPDAETVEARIRAPAGFTVGVWADGLPNVRMLRFTPAGDLLASLPRAGEVVLLERDADGDGASDGRRPLLADLDRPHGLDLHDGWLYVAEMGAVARVRFDAEARQVGGAPERVVTGLPSGGNHWTRTVRFGPDGWLYVSIGSSCNVCIERDPRRAALVRYRPDGSGEEIHATGLRNAVGFDWRPDTGELYATDNGRDLLGDDFPPCELNRIERGGFYGWPFANGDRIPDPDLGAGREREIADSIPPVHGFRAHNAPLGIAFARGGRVPEAYRGAALVALHGSWNRTRKDGYRVVSLHWGPGGIEERDFLVGFEQDGHVIGRPVDVAEGPDGAFYVSDDYAGVVYRVAFEGGGARGSAAAPARREISGDPLGSLDAAERTARAARGESLYQAHACAACHGAEPPPGVVAKPLAGLAGRHDLASLEALLATPTPPMPALPLSPVERRDLAVYLFERHP